MTDEVNEAGMPWEIFVHAGEYNCPDNSGHYQNIPPRLKHWEYINKAQAIEKIRAMIDNGYGENIYVKKALEDVIKMLENAD